MDKRDLVERLRGDAQGEDLGADGMGWSPEPALKREAADELMRLRTENAALKREAHTWWTAARDAAKEQTEAWILVAWVEKNGDLVWHDREAATGRNLFVRVGA